MIDLKRLYSLDSVEKNDRMLDYLFDKIDDQYFTGDLKPIYGFLEEVDVERISTDLGIGILSITHLLRFSESRISFSRKFREKIEKTEDPSRVERLLQGLH